MLLCAFIVLGFILTLSQQIIYLILGLFGFLFFTAATNSDQGWRHGATLLLTLGDIWKVPKSGSKRWVMCLLLLTLSIFKKWFWITLGEKKNRILSSLFFSTALKRPSLRHGRFGYVKLLLFLMAVPPCATSLNWPTVIGTAALSQPPSYTNTLTQSLIAIPDLHAHSPNTQHSCYCAHSQLPMWAYIS